MSPQFLLPMFPLRLLTTVSMACLALPAAALGQDESNEAGVREIEKIEQVTVYGDKIQRSYLETLSSVGVVTAKDLESFDIADTSDAYLRLANVRAFSQGAGSKSISIRGLNADGVTQPANSAALISVVVDGVTQSAEGLKRGSRGLWDTEQLEVHRGPKGTTQGRNALAGAVIINTKDPSFEAEYKFRVLSGQLDRKELAAVFSGPIVDDVLAYRLSAEYAEKSSDIDFSFKENEDFADDEYHNIRGKFLFIPKQLDQLEVLLTVSDVFDSPASSPVTGPDFFARNFASDSAFAEFREMDVMNYNADIAYGLDNGITLRSITSHYDSDLEISSPPSSENFYRDDHRKDSDSTQEFRVELLNDFYGFNGVAGLFFGDFKQDTSSYIRYYGSLIVQDGTFANNTETWAAYIDLRYSLNDHLELIFGGRYQNDSVGQKANYYSGITDTDNVLDEEAKFDVFLPKLGLSYSLVADQTLGFTVSKGYRQGFAEVRLGSEGELVDVDPEYVWAYELAYRITSTDGKLQFGANLFYNDYSDQQVPLVNEEFFPLVNTLNTGDSSSYGLELEGQYAFDDGLSVYGAVGLLETELGDFPNNDCTNSGCDGNSYSEAPKMTASLGGEYKRDSGFFISLATSYTGSYYRNIDNSDDLKVDSYFLVNARIGYEFENVTVSAYANNVLDEEYLTGILTVDQASVGDERNMGVEISASF